MRENKYLAILCLLAIGFVLILKNFNEKARLDPINRTQRVDLIADHNNGQLLDDKEILLKESELKRTKTSVNVKPAPPKPYISAESYIVGDLETGEIYISLNENRVFPIASVSKLYTALVVQHLYDSANPITIIQGMLDAYGEAGELVLGEKFTSDELLNFLLLVSSNDAAEAYAQSFGSGDFIVQMNAFAQEIGMNSTFFKDPSGLNPANVSNAKDLFILAKYLYKDEKGILDVSKTKEIDIATTSDHGSHHLVNINPYTNYPDFIGGKTGRTLEAKESMVSLFKQDIDGVTYPVAVITLRSDFGQREIDTEKLLGLFMDKVKKK